LLGGSRLRSYNTSSTTIIVYRDVGYFAPEAKDIAVTDIEKADMEKVEFERPIDWAVERWKTQRRRRGWALLTGWV
jgi:hypothetical protein